MKGKYTTPLIGIVILIIVIVVLSLATYTVRPGKTALVLQGSKVSSVSSQAGLHWKVPLLGSVVWLDMSTRMAQGKVRLHEDKSGSLAAGYVVIWRISDPRQFYKATAGDVSVVSKRINSVLKPVLQKAMATGTAREFLSGDTAKLDSAMDKAIHPVAAKTGITVLEAEPAIDSVPEELAGNVTATMAAAIQTKIAAAQTSMKAQRAAILSHAKSKSAEIVAEAKRKAATITGKSQAWVASFYAPVARKAPKFFDYYLTLQSKADALKNHTRVLVLSIDSPWLHKLDGAADGKNASP